MVHTEDGSDTTVDADVSNATVVLQRKSGKVILLRLAPEGDGVRFETEDVPMRSVRANRSASSDHAEPSGMG